MTTLKTLQPILAEHPAFFPVIHPVHHVTALRSVETAVEAGVDGIFLINQGMGAHALLELYDDLRRLHPTLWMGLNLLGHPHREVFFACEKYGIQGAWFDDCPENAPPASERSYVTFGGASFKGQMQMFPDTQAGWAANALHTGHFMDVVLTSGTQTGKPAPLLKAPAMRAVLPKQPLGLASGVSLDNLDQYLPTVDVFLVASSLETEPGVLHPSRTRRMAERIHAHPARAAFQAPATPEAP